MKPFTFFLFAVLITGQKADTTPKHIIKSTEIIKNVNQHPETTWKADSYGIIEIDANKFAETHLGVKWDIDAMETIGSTAEPGSEATENTASRGSTSYDNDDIEDNLPKNFNWIQHTKGINCPFGKIRNQGNCGSCWAVSTASSFSDRLCIKSKGKIRTPLSASYVASCDFNNHGCDGGYMDKVYNFLKYNGTVTGGEFESDEGCQPYPIRPCGKKPYLMPCAQVYTPKCRQFTCTNDWYPFRKEKKIYKVEKWRYLNSEFETRKELYENGPITATFVVYADFVFYKSGIYSRTSFSALGGHAVKIVGWGEEKNIKYWLVANSWGTDWGEEGYFRIMRGVNMCGFERGLQALTPAI